jgi:cytolysin-activating lysine-acyltransferase
MSNSGGGGTESDRVAAEASSASLPPPSQNQEALAIGGGTAKALADAAKAARASLQGLDAASLRAAMRANARRLHSAGTASAAQAASKRETDGMNNPPSDKDASKAANGNGASAAQGGAAQGKAKSGSPFTEPTPGGKEKTVAQLFGEIVWLFSQSPKHKNFFISDLEWLVMTPILLKQFRVFYAPDRPIGVALWAYVNDEVEQRLMTGNARLAPADWKGGEKLWLVDIIAPYGGHDAMIADLKEKVFAGREMRFLGLDNGKPSMKSI